MFRLVRYFSITSLVAFLLVTIVLALFYRQSAINDLLVLRESNNVALTQSFANAFWPQFSRFVTSAFTLSPEELPRHAEIGRMREVVLAQMAGELLPPAPKVGFPDIEPRPFDVVGTDDQVHVRMGLVGVQHHRVAVL